MRSCMTEIGNIQLLALCPSGVNPTSMQYRYVNHPSWLASVPGHGEMWVEEHELESCTDAADPADRRSTTST